MDRFSVGWTTEWVFSDPVAAACRALEGDIERDRWVTMVLYLPDSGVGSADRRVGLCGYRPLAPIDGMSTSQG